MKYHKPSKIIWPFILSAVLFPIGVAVWILIAAAMWGIIQAIFKLF